MDNNIKKGKGKRKIHCKSSIFFMLNQHDGARQIDPHIQLPIRKNQQRSQLSPKSPTQT